MNKLDKWVDVIDYSNHDFFKKYKEGCDKKNLYIEDANELINEIKLGTNIYINRGIEDFLELKNM